MYERTDQSFENTHMGGNGLLGFAAAFSGLPGFVDPDTAQMMGYLIPGAPALLADAWNIRKVGVFSGDPRGVGPQHRAG